MEQGFGMLAQAGDSFLPFAIGGVVVAALAVMIVAFVLMRRK